MAFFCLDVSSPVFGFTGWEHIYPEFFGQARFGEFWIEWVGSLQSGLHLFISEAERKPQ